MSAAGEASGLSEGLGPMMLMSTRVGFKRSIEITEGDDLLQVAGKKRGNGARGLILMDVAKLVTQETRTRLVTMANKHGIA